MINHPKIQKMQPETWQKNITRQQLRYYAEQEVKKWTALKIGDRRLHPRKDVFTLVYYATPNKSHSDYLHNISEGGMFIQTRKPLAVGTDTILSFTMPKSNVPINVKGEVMWIDQNGMGVKFKQVDELTKGKIKSVLFQM